MVLLANPGGLLPLSAPSSVAVIGPGADDSGCLFGCYSFPNHVLAAHPEFDLGIKAPTILDAIRAEFPGSSVSYHPGTTVMGGETEGIEAAVRSAAQAEVSILVVGDRSGMFGHGTSGEGCDVTTLDLPGAQGQLADAVLSASPHTVLVVLSGRPYAIGDFAARADATLQVFFPGEEGGPAVAGVISGRVEPSGRLPVQIPAAATNQPGTYLAAPLALRSDGVSNIDPTPAFPFGFGLSYSSLQIDEVVADAAEAPTSGSLQISATVSNTGDRVAWHVPQLYLSDPVASITRPVRRRLSAGRVRLQPGERATVHFDVPCEVLGFTGADLRYRVEPGELVLTVAQSAADPGRSVSVNLTGPVHHAGLGRYRGVTARVDAASS
ncbi:MAG: glycoside hydrolase family 3 C-terminal domain-containing protein [Propionibacterium sp.]